MHPFHRSRLFVCAALVCAVAARADWDLGGPHKMHFPQLPDLNGWDVNVSDYVLADDWQCSMSGPIPQIHFWISWTNDLQSPITNIHLSIHDNVPEPPFSRPGELLWHDDFDPASFQIRNWETGLQGWLDPLSNFWRWPDHMTIWQVNVGMHPGNIFFQMISNIYWLDIKLDVLPPGKAGWKTCFTNFMDDAVFWTGEGWQELRSPEVPFPSLDLAFVIDPMPEPAAAALVVSVWLAVRRLQRSAARPARQHA
ncbi:hypothetical protein GX586_02515 [bacterium]|nr:hypothetical protein [bacterium]